MHVLLVFPFIHLSLIGNLTDEQRKWILKQYWKTENNERIRQWSPNFSSRGPDSGFLDLPGPKGEKKRSSLRFDL